MTESVHGNCCSGKLCFTNGTVNYCIVRACSCASSINFVFNYCCTFCVTESRNSLCVCVAARAGEGLNAVICASRSCCYLGCIRMSVAESRNCTCFNLSASALAVLRAFCINSGLNVNDPVAPCMSGSGNNLLSYENLVANRTVRAFGETCFCASGSNCLVNYGSMTCSSNYLLSYENLITNRTARAFGKTRFCTCGSNCLVNHNCVTERIAIGYSANLAGCSLGTCSLAALVAERRTVCLTANFTNSLVCAGSSTTGVCMFIPITIENGVLCYRVGFKVPNLGAGLILVPIVKEIAFFFRSGRSCNKATFLDCLRGNVNTFASDEVYYIFLKFNIHIGSVDTKPVTDRVAARCEREYHD